MSAPDLPFDAAAEAFPEPLLDRTLVQAFLECVPDSVYFKDRASRFIAVSSSKARRHERQDPAELVGLTDADLFSAEHARAARADEETIMDTGAPLIGKMEKTVWSGGQTTWTEVSKLPLHDEAGRIIGTFGVSRDVTAELAMRAEWEKTRRELVETSRKAGMAEVATGVLHNVGNVLTSLNVSANIIAASLREAKTDSLLRFAALLQEHTDDIGDFVTHDPKGQRVPEFLETIARHAVEEHERLLRELASLQENINHVKDSVAMQQAYATMAGVVEALDPVAVMEEALRMNANALLAHQVAVVRDFPAVPRIAAEKAKVFQVLVNLIANAQHACAAGGRADKQVTLRLKPAGDQVRFVVADNGVGIGPEHLPRIFDHGFTTRKEGHGFGLPSALNAATEMHGTLAGSSPGVGLGATFILTLPIARTEASPAAP